MKITKRQLRKIIKEEVEVSGRTWEDLLEAAFNFGLAQSSKIIDEYGGDWINFVDSFTRDFLSNSEWNDQIAAKRHEMRGTHGHLPRNKSIMKSISNEIRDGIAFAGERQPNYRGSVHL